MIRGVLHHSTVAGDWKRRVRADKRKEARHTIVLPVRVCGDAGNRQWTESTESINVSAGGMALRLSRRVLVNDILFIEAPLPARFQKKAAVTAPFRTYALVRHVEMRADGYQTVRLQFVNKPF